jgi:hypothetical protein
MATAQAVALEVAMALERAVKASMAARPARVSASARESPVAAVRPLSIHDHGTFPDVFDGDIPGSGAFSGELLLSVTSC